jgi:ABC-type branched-subunit amino acid transport system ATPase component/ABC-type branched-subunit amino acid transport system permease subunit
MPERPAAPVSPRTSAAPRFLLLWGLALAAAGISVVLFGRYGAHLVAFGFLYAALSTGWSWMRATGLFSLGHAAFFGAGALTQAWLVTTGRLPAGTALVASAVAGAVAALPLVPALRLGPASFGLATLAYAPLVKGVAGNVRAFGMEGFLLPRSRGFDGAAPAIVGVLTLLALAASLGYELFLRRPSGRSAAALRQQPGTASSLGIDPVGERWRPLAFSSAAAGAAGAVYAQLVGSVETSVVFSPIFSILPLVFGMAGGALHPLGGLVGTLVLYPLDELVLRPALPHAHTLFYGAALLALLLVKPEGLLKARIPDVPSRVGRNPVRRKPFPIVLSGVTVRRGGIVVLTDVSFALEPGRVLRVVGPNGAGKTSLLLAVAGSAAVTRGRVEFGGVPAPGNAAKRARRGLARTFQAPRPFPDWTVRENVAMAAERSGGACAVDEILEDLELTALRDRPADQLSVGEGKRLELARVLAYGPAALLLDEPLAGLAPEVARRVSERIERARREGIGILWVEHGAAERETAGQLLVLEQGRVRFLGSPAAWDAQRPASAS